MSQTGSDTSDEVDDVDDVSPPWGSLPVEKYLLVFPSCPRLCAGNCTPSLSTNLVVPVATMELRIRGRCQRATKAVGEGVREGRLPTSGGSSQTQYLPQHPHER